MPRKGQMPRGRQAWQSRKGRGLTRVVLVCRALTLQLALSYFPLSHLLFTSAPWDKCCYPWYRNEESQRIEFAQSHIESPLSTDSRESAFLEEMPRKPQEEELRSQDQGLLWYPPAKSKLTGPCMGLLSFGWNSCCHGVDSKGRSKDMRRQNTTCQEGAWVSGTRESGGRPRWEDLRGTPPQTACKTEGNADGASD